VNAGRMRLTGVADPRLDGDLKRPADPDSLYYEPSAGAASYRASPHGFLNLVCSYGLLKSLRFRVTVGPSLFIAHRG
jgi:hypothetical protein